jgi:hypothetical protein
MSRSERDLSVRVTKREGPVAWVRLDILPALKGEDSFVGQQAVPVSPKAP